MKKSLIFGSVLLATCFCFSSVEASYIEALIEQYKDKNIQAEYVLYYGKDAIKKYTYAKFGDNVLLKHDFIPAEQEQVVIKEEQANLPSETKKQLNKMNKIAKALSSLSNYGTYNSLSNEYNLNLIYRDKMYFIDSVTQKGKWCNLGDLNKSKVLWEILDGKMHVDSFNKVNVIKDIISSSDGRVKITLLKSYKEGLYFPAPTNIKYDVEEIRIDNLSQYGREIGYSYDCKLYFQNGELKFFTYPEYSKKIWLSVDIDFEKSKNPIFKVESISSVDNESMNYVFNTIDSYQLERIPLGW